MAISKILEVDAVTEAARWVDGRADCWLRDGFRGAVVAGWPGEEGKKMNSSERCEVVGIAITEGGEVDNIMGNQIQKNYFSTPYSTSIQRYILSNFPLFSLTYVFDRSIT